MILVHNAHLNIKRYMCTISLTISFRCL